MIFQIHRLEHGVSQGTGGAEFENNKLQVENGQPDHQNQSATADQQREQQSRSAVLWQ